MRRALVGWAVVWAALSGGCFTNYSSVTDGGASFDDGGFSTDGGADATASGMLSVAPIDFGLVACGSAPAARTFSFQNTGTVPVTWSASANSIFTIQGPSSGSVDPGATGSLTVGASTVPTTSDPGVPVTGTLTITTNIPGYSSVPVPLTLTPKGGSLFITPAVAGFGLVQIGTPGSPLGLSIQNVGNAPVNVTLGTPSDPTFSVTYTGAPAAAAIAPGMTLAGASASFTPTDTSSKTATVAIQTTDPLCASAASSIALSGSGTTAPVSVGPSPLDFGNVPCGTTGTPQTVTIKSGYTSAITFTATLTSGQSPYSLSTSGGTVPAKGTATITVTPAAIPFPSDPAAGAYDDTLTVTTTAPNAPAVAIPLTQVASGAVLTLSLPATDFGTVTNVGSLPFTVTNAGTLEAALTLVATGPGFGGTFTTNNFAAANGGTAPGNATFAPKSNNPASGTLALSTTTPLCAPLPQPVMLTGTGAIPIATFPSTALALAFTLCGSNKAPAPQTTLVVQNTGVAPLQLYSPASTLSYFSIVSYTTSAIPPGQTGSITLKGVLPPGYKCFSTYDDTLTFATNEPGDPTYTVPVAVSINQ